MRLGHLQINQDIMNFVSNSVHENIVSGNIKRQKIEFVSTEDVSFNEDEIKSSTKKNLADDLKNVWKLLNNIHQDQIEFEKSWIRRKKLEAQRNFDDQSQSSLNENGSNQDDNRTLNCIADYSNIFKMSFEEINREPFQLEVSRGNANLSWNDGNFSTNAISDPWSIRVPGVECESSLRSKMDDTCFEEVALVSPPRVSQLKLPFNIRNLLCRKRVRKY